jgi:predicted PurR-regulated permease PerM
VPNGIEQERRERAKTASLVILATIAVLVVLATDRGSEFFVPIAFTLVLYALFQPIVRWLQRFRVPPWIGSAIIVLALMGAMAAGVWALARPVRQWVTDAPRHFEEAQSKLEKIRRPVQQVTAAANKIEHAADGGGSTTQPAGSSPSAAPPAPGLLAGVLGTTQTIVGGLIEVLLLLFLLLAAGDLFLEKLVKVLPVLREKKAAVQNVQDAERVVRRYILVTAIINACQGAIIALIMWWIGMPTPILWGLFTFVLEFIPYLGATVMIALLAITAFTKFDALGHILLAPATYLVITTLQNNVVSPIAYGKGLKLNPVAVLVGVIFWWVIWGTPGAFIAVPILATIKILAERSESEALKTLGEFLGE